MTLLAEAVAASKAVADTGSRTGKVALLADLLEKLEPEELAPVVGFLAGVPRQGRVGVGYSTVYGIEHETAGTPSLTIADLDRTIASLQVTTGGGSAAGRKELLTELLSRATPDEADFVKRLLTGELRQGALAGVMTEAIAKAAGVSGALVRRALMLSGDLPRTAEITMGEGEEGLRGVGLDLFRPVFPMLASTAESAAEAVAGYERASVEWKLDGIRIQIHRRGEEVRVYTRNLNNITEGSRGSSTPCVAFLCTRPSSTARRLDGRARPGRVPGNCLEDRSRRTAGGSRDLPLRPPARRRRGSARHAARAARGQARGAGAGPEDPGAPHVQPGRGKPRARRGAERRTRGRRREGRGVPVRGRPAWQVVEEGEAGSDLRPGRTGAPSGDTADERAGSRTCISGPATRRQADS
jgi:ATP dependent DNA ligase domain/DNA ligase N terminus